MGQAGGLFRRLWMLVRRGRFRSELDEEMAFHREEQEREFAAAGMTPMQARLAARRRFGNSVKLREESHRIVAFRWESVWQDVRYAARQLTRSPGFAFTTVLTLTLGIGATATIYTLVYSSLLRSLPYPEADRILHIEDVRTHGQSTGGLVGVPRFFDLDARNRSFESLAYFYFDHPTLIAGAQLPLPVKAVGASSQFWKLFGVQPLLGRTFDDKDCLPNAPDAVVLSYGAWQQLFGGDRSVIGRQVLLDRKQAAIVGIMPPGFRIPNGIDLWRPSHFTLGQFGDYRSEGTRFVNVYGRLKPGMTAQAAQADLLMIACINVANLLLSRATVREREVALRRALGASNGRILLQFLTESTLLSLMGGSFGLAAAYSLARTFGSRLPGSLGAPGMVGMNWPVAGFALALSASTGIAFGLAPAWQNRRVQLNTALKRGETRFAGTSGSRVRNAFISVQVGLSLILLVGACLLAESLWNLMKSPLGFDPDHLLTFATSLPWDTKAASIRNFYTSVQQRIEALPGVTAVGQIDALPTTDWHLRSNFDADWIPRIANRPAINAEDRHIAGDYLRAVGTPLLAGRTFTDRDFNIKNTPVLVNQQLEREYLPGGDPIGKHLIVGTDSFEIVGVVGDVRGTTGSIAQAVGPEVYWPADDEQGVVQRSFVVRSQLPPEQLTKAIRKLVHQVDPEQAIANVRTMDTLIDTSVAQPRLNMALLVSFAGIALVLACVGIYGVVAYSVAQRKQEIGVRMALGATRGQISMLFLRRTLAAALIGLSSGGVATLLLTRLLSSQLYGVEPNNPRTFLIAILLLLTPVFVASLRPALRAASIDPVEALRTE
ncbi:ABC transporter permease [Acidicapsa acidisoli]|uniref:ABC transporter permease n=1 Tax=Acidicapsa acidisoli TaxID=1615681 RepID=UPI0021E09912|nr:ABC transporter permease [Acidicapsa acidisoli]